MALLDRTRARAFRSRGRRDRLSTVTIAAIVLVAVASFLLAGCASAPKLSAKQVLERSVADLLALKTYTYKGTSSMRVPSDPRLDSDSTFLTVLAQNGKGGLDGHMVVQSPSYSYETYGYRGTEYTRVKGADWTRVARGDDYGMVSTDARRIIAEFAELVEDVKIESETASTYTVSMVMGEKYRRGAAAVAGTPPVSTPAAAEGAGGTKMSIVVGKKDLRMRSVFMSDTSSASGDAPAVTIVTKGTYSHFNEPTDITPPPEALK